MTDHNLSLVISVLAYTDLLAGVISLTVFRGINSQFIRCIMYILAANILDQFCQFLGAMFHDSQHPYIFQWWLIIGKLIHCTSMWILVVYLTRIRKKGDK